jgi:hypothetical protein
MAAGSPPTHKAFLVEDRGEGNDPFWTEVAAAWQHRDGRGMDLIIKAGMALTGRIVIREAAERPETGNRRDRSARNEPSGRR